MVTIKVFLFLVFTIFTVTLTQEHRLNPSKDKQFPPGTEQLVLPSIICFTLHMGSLNYNYYELTLESMRWNPTVDFVLIHILTGNENTDAENGNINKNTMMATAKKMSVTNFRIHEVKITDFSSLVNSKLKLNVNFTKEWFYKMADYKPTIAYLFPELLNKVIITPTSENSKPRGGDSKTVPYKFWGYVDMDLIWGNMTRYAYLFQGMYPVVVTGKL